jgi:hypothetical protein
MVSMKRILGFDLLRRTVGAIVALRESELLEVLAFAADTTESFYFIGTLAPGAVEAAITGVGGTLAADASLLVLLSIRYECHPHRSLFDCCQPTRSYPRGTQTNPAGLRSMRSRRSGPPAPIIHCSDMNIWKKHRMGRRGPGYVRIEGQVWAYRRPRAEEARDDSFEESI